MMDFLQDLLFGLEDKPDGYAETLVTCEDDSTSTADEVQDEEQLIFHDCTAAGVMGWLTGRKHKPLNGEPLMITVKFNHDCMVDNPDYTICYPTVRGCSKEISLPVAHMKTPEAFNGDGFIYGGCFKRTDV